MNTFWQTYAILYQAYTQTVQDNGLPSTRDLTERNYYSSKRIFENLKPYLKNYKDIGSVIERTAESKGVASSFNRLNPTTEGQASYNFLNNSYAYYFAIPNGTVIFLYWLADNQSVFMVWNLNGRKAPNTFGKDVFLLMLSDKKKSPVITSYSNGAFVPGQDCCSLTIDTGNAWYSGGSCATWVLRYWNMDYLHKSDEEIPAAW